MFTKQHYEIVADVLRRQYVVEKTADGRVAIDALAWAFIDEFEGDNPLFDKGKFLDAVYADA